jgi:putative ABC transport system ATP-binding protein
MNTSAESPIISLKGVSKSYRLGQISVPALKNVSLDIHSGEFAAVIGASGSGKTTLLNIIGCIDSPDSGVVELAGINVQKLSDNEKSDLRNQKISFIFQTFNLVPVLSVFENVELPLLINRKISREERATRVRQAITDVGLEKYAGNRPDQLSGGQRQRAAIARALAGHPALVLADEPTANLDSENSNKIIDLMMHLNSQRNVTFLFSTHDEKLMGRVGRIIHIKDGVLEA